MAGGAGGAGRNAPYQPSQPNQPYPPKSSNSDVTLLRTPSGARGSSGACLRISAFVNPGVTSPAVARAVHQDGFRCIFAPRAPFLSSWAFWSGDLDGSST